MSEWDNVKIVGRRLAPASAADCLRHANILVRAAAQLSPYRRPRGFVFKARTYADYERWRREQTNPWLW